MRNLSLISERKFVGWRAFAASLTGAALTAACAQLAFHLPGNPVPLTMQVFAVVLCGMVLGSRLALLAQIEYLTAGALGLPVFAGFKAGWPMLLGPTGGYLIGFAAAAFLIGWVVERSPRANLAIRTMAGLSGVAVIYILGRCWFAFWLMDPTGTRSWILGVAPFVGADCVKVLAAAAITSGRWKPNP